MVKFHDKVNANLLQKTIEQLAIDIGLPSSTLTSWLDGTFIEDDYPDTIEFDPELSPTSVEEWAEFKALSKYSPEQTLLIKKMVLLYALGGDFSGTINTINNFILQDFEFFQTMDYLCGCCHTNNPKYDSIMLTNPQRPEPDRIKRYVEFLNRLAAIKNNTVHQ